MKTLKLTFNESFEFVKLVLAGEGSYLVEEKREHVDVLCHEIINLIQEEHPDVLLFESHLNHRLLDFLLDIKITYDDISGKLSYNK